MNDVTEFEYKASTGKRFLIEMASDFENGVHVTDPKFGYFANIITGDCAHSGDWFPTKDAAIAACEGHS